MTFTFLTNLVNHHQIPLADEMHYLLGDDYHYIATEPLPDWLKKGGYSDTIERTYIIKAYESDEKYQEATSLVNESDVVMHGAAPFSFVKQRLDENKVTFGYKERIFKDGYYHLLSPRALANYYKYYTRYRDKKYYMLCASAFTAPDTAKLFAFPNKCFKWGYFTSVDLNCDINNCMNAKEPNSILWVARFINWKHPETAVLATAKLKAKGYSFKLRMIGGGELKNETEKKINEYGLTDCITLLGNMPNKEVLEWMKRSSIFIFTSDRNEGWGAVLNEAMSNACTAIASNRIGASPFLIKDGLNGFTYKDGDTDDLANKIAWLLEHPDENAKLGVAAYKTMAEEWNPQKAAHRLLTLSQIALNESTLLSPYKSGPCSKAL